MRITTFLFITLLTFSSVNCESKLVQIIELIRHGARGPLENAYDSESQKETFGQLNEVGMHQNYQLGYQIRREYVIQKQLISPNYNPYEVLFISTPVNRTLMSAQSHLMGLFPNGPTLPVSSKDLILPPYKNIQYQPIANSFALPNGVQVFPIYTVSNDTKSLLPYNCPKYSKMQQKNFKKNSDFIEEVDEVNKQLYQDVSTMTGDIYKSFLTLKIFEDVMTADIFVGRPLPKGMTQEQITKIQQLRSILWFLAEKGDPAKALQSTTLQFILDQFAQKAKGQSERKYILLSGHDSNIVRALLLLDASSHECQWQKFNNKNITALNCEDSPKFASNLIFELWKDSEDNTSNYHSYFVKVKYNGKYIFLCEQSAYECGLDIFTKKTSEKLGDYADLCGIETEEELKEKYESEKTENIVLIVLLAIFALATTLLGVALYKIKKSLDADKAAQNYASGNIANNNSSVTYLNGQQPFYQEMQQV